MSVRLQDGSLFGFALTRPLSVPAFTTTQFSALKILLQAYASSAQRLQSRLTEKSLLFSLNHRVLQLNSLIDTGIEVSKFNDAVRPEQLALERAASLTNSACGRVTVVSAGGEREVVRFPHGMQTSAFHRCAHRIRSTFKFMGAKYAFELFDKESRNGVQPFDETDQLLLDALARQVHGALENRHLHAQAVEKQRMERDMVLAAAIQQRILPMQLPAITGYDVAGVNIPSRSVGGDYYDCIALPDGRYAFVIADVAGKGIPAALLVSSFHAFLSAYLEASLPLHEFARRLNRVIRHAATEDKYVTAFFGLLTPATGHFHALNAGHNPVFVLRPDGAVRELAAGGLPIGMLDMEIPYQSEELVLDPGDRVLFYTDGVTEAANERDEFFDTQRPLKELFASHAPSSAGEFIRDLIAEVKAFTGAAPQNDDITALYLIRAR